MRTALRVLSLLLLAIPLALFGAEAPGMFWREILFLAEVLAVTVVTRTVSEGEAVRALALGVGVAIPITVFTGWGFEALGIDVSEPPANWAIVPAVEELVKLAMVVYMLSWRRRRLGLTFNPSDWLVMGAFAGAGFAIVENALLVAGNPSVLRDMDEQFGPHLGAWYLVPGAWGVAGYVGHAAATSFIAGAIGLSLWCRRSWGPIVKGLPWWAIGPIAGVWIVLEHLLGNLHVDTGSNWTFLLGNGRLTPHLFVVLTGIVIAADLRNARRTMRRSPILHKRVTLLKEATFRLSGRVPKHRLLVAKLLVGQLRLLNAAAWLSAGPAKAPRGVK